MKKRSMKVNVAFNVEVDPTKHFNPASLIAPYIENICYDVLFGRFNKHTADWDESDPKMTENTVIYERIADPKREEESRERHRHWLAEKEKETQHLYNMSWLDFSRLNCNQQSAVRKENNVVWRGGKYVREIKPIPQICNEK